MNLIIVMLVIITMLTVSCDGDKAGSSEYGNDSFII